MARRVGSAKAEKVASRLSIGHSLYNLTLISKENFVTFMGKREELRFLEVWPIDQLRGSHQTGTMADVFIVERNKSKSYEAQTS